MALEKQINETFRCLIIHEWIAFLLIIYFTKDICHGRFENFLVTSFKNSSTFILKTLVTISDLLRDDVMNECTYQFNINSRGKMLKCGKKVSDVVQVIDMIDKVKTYCSDRSWSESEYYHVYFISFILSYFRNKCSRQFYELLILVFEQTPLLFKCEKYCVEQILWWPRLSIVRIIK